MKKLAGKPFAELTIGVPKETADGERRVAQTPDTVGQLVKKGFAVSVQSGAGEGERRSATAPACTPMFSVRAIIRNQRACHLIFAAAEACFSDADYVKAGARISDSSSAWKADVVVKVRTL